MSIKTKSDIPFLKFLAFSQDVKENANEDFVADKIIETFYKGNYKNKDKKVMDFLTAMQTSGKLKMRYRIDLKVLEKAGNFIDAEVFTTDEDFEALFKILLKKRYFWQKLDVHKISMTEGEAILANFRRGLLK